MLTLLYLYGLVVCFQMICWLPAGIDPKPAFYAALKLYAFRMHKLEAFFREHTRATRIAELDEKDHALIDANKEVKALLEHNLSPQKARRSYKDPSCSCLPTQNCLDCWTSK